MLSSGPPCGLRRSPLLVLLLLLLASHFHAFSGPASAGRSRYALTNSRPVEIGRAEARMKNAVNAGENPSAIEEGNSSSVSFSAQLSSFATKFGFFLHKNFFLIGMVVAVSMARAFPALGRDGGLLRPDLFIGKFGVTCIFLLSGLSLEVSELKEAASNFKLNFAVQLVTFAAWPFIVGLPLKSALATFFPYFLPPALLDGLLILTCLPTTINMCIFLTAAAGGNVASSLCNVVISNLGGIFLTPALLLRFFGASIKLPFVDMVLKLCNKVLLPVALGQVLRKTKAKDVYEKNSKKFKRLQELILLGIVWNAFCNAFSKGMGLEARHALALLGILPAIHMASLAILFKVFQQPFWGLSRGETVAAMFCASHKTLAFGLPLVNTIFEGNPNMAAYCAPIMFIHPLQLIVGSLLVPKLIEYTKGEEVQK